MNRWIAGKILYPIHERLRGRPTFRILGALRRAENLGEEGVLALRDRRVSDLVRHAAREVPHWRDVFAGLPFAPQDVSGAGDLACLPTMDKPLIREHLERLVATSWSGRVFKLETGGSSGEPLIFYTDRVREASQLAVKARFRAWWGIRPGDRQVDLWGSPIELDAREGFREWKDRLLGYRILSAFELSDENMAGFRRVIQHNEQLLSAIK